MKLIRHTAPFIRRKANVERMMLDVVIALMPVTMFAIWLWGFNALSVILMSVGIFLVVELIALALMKWPKGMQRRELFSKAGFLKIKELYTVNNFIAPIISGLIFALILPAGTGMYITFLGALFGSLIGKMVFGGLGQNIFNPAAVGRAMLTAFFSLAVITPVIPGMDVAAGGTALGSINNNIENFPSILESFPLSQIFFGFMGGAMGEVNSMLILAGGLYLFIRRSADIRVFLSLVLSFAAIMAVAGLSVFGADRIVLDFVLFQLLTGGLLFAAVFMATDPITSPVTKFGRVLFGLGIGALTAFIRLFGNYPEGAVFAILLMNMLVPLIDNIKMKSSRYSLKQAGILFSILAVLLLVVYFAI